jgi:hypothetical protein
MEAIRVYLERVADENLVEAELLDEITDHHLNLWQTTWKPAMVDAVARLERAGVPKSYWPQDMLWDWSRKTAYARSYIGMRSFCIVCNGYLQGMMQVDCTREARLAGQAGKPIVYVDFLSTAPWNRKELIQPHKFRGVGRVLILAAIQLSADEEFQGRIGLHSLPQADAFYADKCGMTPLGRDARYENLTYFEMTSSQAKDFMQLKK